MKTFFRSLSVLAAWVCMVTLVSCSEDNPIDVPQPEPVVTNGSGLLYATTERPHATRTALDPIMDGTTLTGYDVVWSEGDEIELIVGEGRGRRQFIYELVDGEGESSGHFRYKWYEEEGDPLAAFPGQPYVAHYYGNDGSYVWPLPDPGRYDCPMLAWGVVDDDGTIGRGLSFYNMGGLFQVTIKGDGGELVKSVTLKANEPLAGNYTFDTDELMSGAPVDYDDVLSISEYAGLMSTTMDCGDGIPLSSTGTTFTFALPVGTYTGVSVTLDFVDETLPMRVKTLKDSYSLVVERAMATPASFAARYEVPDYLCFTAQEEGSTISMDHYTTYGSPLPSLETSTDLETWTDFVVDETVITLPKVGDKVYFRCKAGSVFQNNNFNMTGTIAASGNVMSLVDPLCETTTFPEGNNFYHLFSSCESLTTAPRLPATTLVAGCYEGMFSWCSSLTVAPELPATTLPRYCYSGMFRECTSLKTTPTLPAVNAGEYACSWMFSGCTSLTTVNPIAAVNLSERCFYAMFAECSALTSLPDNLPATVTAPRCYQHMFAGCSSLKSIPAGFLPATELSEGCYREMFHECTSLTSLPGLPATTMASVCYQSMFSGCSSLKSIPADLLPSTTLALGCYKDMFAGCTGLTSVPEDLLPASVLAEQCYFEMFVGCTGLTSIPAGLLPSTTLADHCYGSMFDGCTGIKSIPAALLPATSLKDACYQGMFMGTGVTSIPAGLLPATSLEGTVRCYSSMFKDCESLVSLPEGLLPATTLSDWCYSSMFEGCTSLSSVSEDLLPATTMKPRCYHGMFKLCSSLKYAPVISATELAIECFLYMFDRCSSLQQVKVRFTSWYTPTREEEGDNDLLECAFGWLDGVKTFDEDEDGGAFYCPEELDMSTIRRVPTGWTIYRW